MHENLMSTVNVDASFNAHNSDYKNDNHWQTLASGNRFGSFFVLYGKFRGRMKDSLFCPNECDLYLQTFDGCMNIGLAHKADEPIKMELGFHPLFRTFLYVLRVKLEPLNTNNHLHKQEINFVKPISNFEYLKPDQLNKKDTYLKGLPHNSPMIIDMFFTDLDDMHIHNSFKSQNVTPNSANSPLLDGDKYIREGSRILKIETQPVNENIEEYFDPEDFSKEYLLSLKQINPFSPSWTNGKIPIKDGVVMGFGCHPNTVRIAFNED